MFNVSLPEFPGCGASSTNKDDALNKADKALSAHIGRIVNEAMPRRCRKCDRIRSCDQS